MMDKAKALTPGVHALGHRLHWEGITPRPITIGEARGIAESVYDDVCDAGGSDAAMTKVREAIVNMTGLHTEDLARDW